MNLSAYDAICLIVRSINVWLAITGRAARVEAADVVVTERAGVIFLAFPFEHDEVQG